MKPIFIGGTGRSGTSILKKLLLHHPQIVGIVEGELRVLVDPGGALDLIDALTRDWTPQKGDDAIQAFLNLMADAGAKNTALGVAFRKFLLRLGASPRRYGGLDLASQFGRSFYEARLHQLIGELTYHVAPGRWVGSPSYRLRSKIYETDPLPFPSAAGLIRTFFDDLYGHLARRQGKDATHWLDDTPYNLLRADRLLAVFPDMTLIHIHRDPRDVLASYVRQDWGGDDLIAAARRLGNIFSTWARIREELPPSSYLEVAFEDLARSPQEQLARMIAFINLPDYCFREDELALIDPDLAHIGRWEKDIPPEALARAMVYLSPWVEQYEN